MLNWLIWAGLERFPWINLWPLLLIAYLHLLQVLLRVVSLSQELILFWKHSCIFTKWLKLLFTKVLANLTFGFEQILLISCCSSITSSIFSAEVPYWGLLASSHSSRKLLVLLLLLWSVTVWSLVFWRLVIFWGRSKVWRLHVTICLLWRQFMVRLLLWLLVITSKLSFEFYQAWVFWYFLGNLLKSIVLFKALFSSS